VELQEEGDCLLLFAEAAPHELAWQVRQLTRQPALAARLVDHAARYVAAHQWSTVAPQVLAQYERLLATR
jgi:hypothetical protein